VERLAFKLRENSGHEWAWHVVFVMKGGKVLAHGVNKGNIHAEWACLNKLWPNKRKDTTIISYRITRSGKLAMARPCPKCFALLKKFGVKKVIYSGSDGLMHSFRVSQGLDFNDPRYSKFSFGNLKFPNNIAAYYASGPWPVN
jgi:hypothetical protein